jgi:autotransporter-associated beta strand protein
VTVAGGGLNLASSTDTVASFTITSGSLFGSGKLTAAAYALGGGTITGNFGGGTMTVTANSNLNGTADVTSLRLNAGTLTLGSAGRFTSNQVALTGSSGGSLSLVGNESVGSLAGAFNIALGSATLTTGNGNTSTTYAGALSGSGGLAKTGTGTFTLSGSSSYTGATAVNGGKLLVNGQLGNTAVAVNASGLLGGSGTILGNVTVASSGTLAPGNSPGVFTVGSLSLLAGSHTLMEITGTAAGFYDQIVGTGLGGLTYGSSLNLVMTGSCANQTVFHLFSNFSSYTGDFSAVGLNATGEYAGLTFAGDGGVWTSTETANGQRLVFSTGTGDLIVVPEPSTYAMALAGLACGGWQMFRRRRLRQASTLAA